jgi:hypothetical protein
LEFRCLSALGISDQHLAPCLLVNLAEI